MKTAEEEVTAETTEDFVWMPVNVVTRKDLTGSARIVYTYLFNQLDGDGAAWLSCQQIADGCGICRNAARRAVKELDRKGLVGVEHAAGGVSCYWLRDEGPRAPSGAADGQQGGTCGTR